MVVAEAGEGGAKGLVGDFEVSAAGEFLELDECEVRLDAGGVAVHEQTDGAGGCDDRRLRVAVAVLLAEIEGAIPRGACGVQNIAPEQGDVSTELTGVDGNGSGIERFIAGFGVGGAAMVADDAQHVLSVFPAAGERPMLARHLGAGGIALAGEDGGQCAADGAAGLAVVGDARLHEHGTEIRVAQAQCAVLVGKLGDALARKARHQDTDFKHDRPQPRRVAVAVNIEAARVGVEKREHVQRRQVARGVVEEHVLAAIMNRNAIGDEAARRRLGQVENLLNAQCGKAFNAVPVVAALCGEGHARDDVLKPVPFTARQKADVLREKPEALGIDAQHGIVVVSGDDATNAEAEENKLNILEQSKARRAQADRFVRDDAIGGEQAAQQVLLCGKTSGEGVAGESTASGNGGLDERAQPPEHAAIAAARLSGDRLDCW